MSPSIEAYNSMAHGLGLNDWEEIEKVMPGVDFQCSLQQYYTLTVYATNIIKDISNPEHYKFSQSHDDIMYVMRDVWKLQDTPYRLYNIDHHHDTGYNSGDTLNYEIVKKQDPSCANWVIHLQDICPHMEQYCWINNFNSVGIQDETIIDHLPNYMQSSDLSVLNYLNFDYVFLCSSPGWTPPKYMPLFQTLSFSLDRIINK